MVGSDEVYIPILSIQHVDLKDNYFKFPFYALKDASVALGFDENGEQTVQLPCAEDPTRNYLVKGNPYRVCRK